MNSKQKNKKNTNKPLIVLIIVVVVAVAFMYWMMNKGKDTTKQKGNTSTVESTQKSEEPEMPSLINFNNTENAKIADGEKENVSEEMKKEKTYQGLIIKNVELKTEKGRVSQLTATVENNSASDFAGGKIIIVYTKEDGSELKRVNGVLPPIAKGESNTLSAGTTEDVVNAYSFRIEAAPAE